MSTDPTVDSTGKSCRLLIPFRAADGTYHQTTDPHPVIVRQVENLGRIMLLIRFSNDSTTFVFPDEIEIID